MKPFRLSRRVWIGVVVLIASNLVTGLVTKQVVRARDFSRSNLTCLLNWGSINEQFDNAFGHTLPHDTPMSLEKTYQIHEDNVRFRVHYPRYNHRISPHDDGVLELFCWAVAADNYRTYNVDIPVDPLVWQAFLNDGPKDLPVYWWVRQSLTDAGAGRGLIHGGNAWGPIGPKHSVYVMPPLSRPYRPLAGEGTPL